MLIETVRVMALALMTNPGQIVLQKEINLEMLPIVYRSLRIGGECCSEELIGLEIIFVDSTFLN